MAPPPMPPLLSPFNWQRGNEEQPEKLHASNNEQNDNDFSLPLFHCRRMFPTVRCSFTNLRPDRKYWVLLDIVPCDNKRYRYAYHRSSWLVAGKADPPPPHRFYPHPDAPYTGEQLRKQVVSFEKIKLTNNEMDKTGQVSA